MPAKTQNYLKVIWDLHRHTGEKAALGDVAERTDEKRPAANEAVKELATRDLVDHELHQGIGLSGRGRDIALTMMRRHRLIKSFLVSTLGYTQDEVHEEAEKLEYMVSKEFINHIDAMLEFPERDPHGDSVPSTSGTIANVAHTDLTDIEADAMVVVDHINDFDPKLLRYLAISGVGPGTVFRTETTLYAGMYVFVILDEVDDTEPKRIHAADPILWAIKATPTAN